MKLDVLKKDLRFAAGILQKRPFDCLIQVTNRCNLRCSFCDFWPNPAPPRDELTVDEYRDLSAQLRELGCFLISIEGGEPFLRQDLVDIVRAFSADHLPILFTSGWYVTPENAAALWDAGLHLASVSIDFASAADHDAKRGRPGTTERAWRAVDILRDSAPRGGRQVNVMSVLMESNWQDMEALFRASAARSVGHQVTLLSTMGTRRRQGGDALPPPAVADHMTRLFDRYPHVRFFREYFSRMDAFLSGGEMPTCRAGHQSFNIDHVGNVSACIERIDKPVGNLRRERLTTLHRRLIAADEQSEVSRCQQCWTACRGLSQSMGNRGTARTWREMVTRMRSHS